MRHTLDEEIREQNEASCQMEGIHEIEDALLLLQILMASHILSLTVTFHYSLSFSQKLRKFLTLDLVIDEMECHE